MAFWIYYSRNHDFDSLPARCAVIGGVRLVVAEPVLDSLVKSGKYF